MGRHPADSGTVDAPRLAVGSALAGRGRLAARVEAGDHAPEELVHHHPRHAAEQALCHPSHRSAQLAVALDPDDTLLPFRLDPDLRVRLNYPYRGDSDGLTTWLRRRHPAARYLGIELEINQALVGGRRWQRFQDVMVRSVAELIDGKARVDSAAGRR